jgi:hypothetical protein
MGPLERGRDPYNDVFLPQLPSNTGDCSIYELLDDLIRDAARFGLALYFHINLAKENLDLFLYAVVEHQMHPAVLVGRSHEVVPPLLDVLDGYHRTVSIDQLAFHAGGVGI